MQRIFAGVTPERYLWLYMPLFFTLASGVSPCPEVDLWTAKARSALRRFIKQKHPSIENDM